MALLKKLAITALIVLGLVGLAPAATAEEPGADQKSFSEHVDQCMITTEFGRDVITKGVDEAKEEMLDSVKNGPEEDQGFLGRAQERMNRGMCRTEMAVAHPVAAASAAASKFWGDPVGDFTKAVLEGNNEALQTVMTFWMDYRLDKSTIDASVQGVKNIVLSLSGLALIASLIIGGGRIAAGRRRGLVEGVEDTGETIALYLLFSLLVPGLVAGAVVASDQLSDWIMKSFGATNAEEVLGASALNDSQAGPIFMLAITGVAFAGSIMQIVALAVRTLLLPIAAGLTPMMAAMSFTQTGKSGLHHLISLMVASIIFKPVSALLYCVVFWMSAKGGEDFVSLIITAVMVGAAGFSGPALVRALVPAVAQAGGGGAAPVLAGGASMAGGALGMASGMIAGKAAGSAVAGASQKATGSPSGGGYGGPNAAGGGPVGGGPVGGGPIGGGGGGGASGSPSTESVAAGASGSGASGRAGGSPSTESVAAGASGSLSAGAGAGGLGGAVAGGSRASGVSRASGGNTALGASGEGRRSHGTTFAGARGGMGARSALATGARAGASAARVAETSANRMQSILDESVGSQGSYSGQMRR